MEVAARRKTIVRPDLFQREFLVDVMIAMRLRGFWQADFISKAENALELLLLKEPAGHQHGLDRIASV